MAVKIELSFQGSCQKPLETKSAANGLLSGFCVCRESFCRVQLTGSPSQLTESGFYSARSLEHAFQCHDQKIVNCFLITFLISSHSEYQAHRTWIQRNQLNPMIIETFITQIH